ncbi:ATP-dependent zinc protease family protein [Pleomorphovibrio marinus]|uniref:ATP-dependent zinc protease family protein n=1 Tax=Pleomorphovibrio marinus TaxID=2164132 RepID=UPI000E09F805|nr:RimK/LysX family protein [Pleomorphovibrio marinus]
MKKVIGRKTKISLPEWEIEGVLAKVDTGAYTSAVHAEEVKEELEDGHQILKFSLLPPHHPKHTGNLIQTRNYTIKKVKNSFGQVEHRYKVKTKVDVMGDQIDAEFTLSDRKKMKNAILLGRKLLKGRFLVDVDLVPAKSKKQIP